MPLAVAFALAGCKSRAEPVDIGHGSPTGHVMRISVAAQNNSGQVFQYMAKAYSFLAEKAMQGNMDEVVDLVVENLDLEKPTVESFVASEHMK